MSYKKKRMLVVLAFCAMNEFAHIAIDIPFCSAVKSSATIKVEQVLIAPHFKKFKIQSMNRQDTIQRHRDFRNSIQGDFAWDECESNGRSILHSSRHCIMSRTTHTLCSFGCVASDSSEAELRTVMPHVSLRNYVAVSPRGTMNSADSKKMESRFSWNTSRPHVEIAERRVVHCVQMAIRKYNISPRKIFIAGLEEGGTMALQIGLKNPDLFAGALSLNGAFLTMNAPLSQIDKAARCRCL